MTRTQKSTSSILRNLHLASRSVIELSKGKVVLAADALDVANVMTEEREHKAEFIQGRNVPLRKVFAANDFLPDQSYHNRVVDVMVEHVSV